jgi:hypothetical protein
MSTTFLVQHIPHIVPAIMAFAVLARLGFVVADQPPAQLSDEEIEAWRHERAERAVARRVRRTSARLGLIALPCLLAAVGTGLALYTLSLRGDRPSTGFAWFHSVVSILAIALVGWKVAEGGWTRLRRGLDPRRIMLEGVSLVLALLGVPLLITGVVLLAAPSDGSFSAYAHLVASVWWMLLLGAHLVRYLGRSLDAALRGRASDDPAASARR